MDFTYIDLKTGQPTVSPLGDMGGGGVGAEVLARSWPALGSDQRIRMDAEHIVDLAHSRGLRGDSVTSEAGTLARDLNYKRKTIIEEPHALPNSFGMFRLDPDQPPPGARTYSVRYSLSHGEAVLHRGGSESQIPVVGGSMIEDTFKLWPLVTSFTENYFESQSSAFAGYDTRARDVRTARRVLEETANRINWTGDAGAGLYGILNYPRLAKRVESTAFDGTAAPTDVLAALFAGANYPGETSKGVFKPTRCVTSPRVRNYLAQTRLGSVNDTTIGKFFLDGMPDISKIDAAWELEEPAVLGAGSGSGVDGILFYSDDPQAASLVVPQGITMLPPFRMGFNTTTIVAMVVGGARMDVPGSAILLLVQAPS
jgi:hypothetical protein